MHHNPILLLTYILMKALKHAIIMMKQKSGLLMSGLGLWLIEIDPDFPLSSRTYIYLSHATCIKVVYGITLVHDRMFAVYDQVFTPRRPWTVL